MGANNSFGYLNCYLHDILCAHLLLVTRGQRQSGALAIARAVAPRCDAAAPYHGAAGCNDPTPEHRPGAEHGKRLPTRGASDAALTHPLLTAPRAPASDPGGVQPPQHQALCQVDAERRISSARMREGGRRTGGRPATTEHRRRALSCYERRPSALDCRELASGLLVLQQWDAA
jgi:hypothetical protein